MVKRKVEFVYYYRCIEERFQTPETGDYTSFGIAAFRRLAGRWQTLFQISDVSLDEKRVHELAALCTRYQLHPEHLLDVVEDSLCGEF